MRKELALTKSTTFLTIFDSDVWLSPEEVYRSLRRVYPYIENGILRFHFKKKGKVMNNEPPKLVIHTLCGVPVFYYFGTKEDAQQLKNFDDITTLEGDAITPQDITKCVGCGEKIRINQVQIAVHEVKVHNTIFTDNKLTATQQKLIEDRIKLAEQHLISKKPPNPITNDFFWFDKDNPDIQPPKKNDPE